MPLKTTHIQFDQIFCFTHAFWNQDNDQCFALPTLRLTVVITIHDSNCKSNWNWLKKSQLLYRTPFAAGFLICVMFGLTGWPFLFQQCCLLDISQWCFEDQSSVFWENHSELHAVELEITDICKACFVWRFLQRYFIALYYTSCPGYSYKSYSERQFFDVYTLDDNIDNR